MFNFKNIFESGKDVTKKALRYGAFTALMLGSTESFASSPAKDIAENTPEKIYDASLESHRELYKQLFDRAIESENGVVSVGEKTYSVEFDAEGKPQSLTIRTTQGEKVIAFSDTDLDGKLDQCITEIEGTQYDLTLSVLPNGGGYEAHLQTLEDADTTKISTEEYLQWQQRYEQEKQSLAENFNH